MVNSLSKGVSQALLVSINKELRELQGEGYGSSALAHRCRVLGFINTPYLSTTQMRSIVKLLA